MEQDTQIELDHPDAGRRHGLIIWAARGALALCGGLLVLVVLSNPVIAPRLTASVAPGDAPDTQKAVPVAPKSTQASAAPRTEPSAPRKAAAKGTDRARPTVSSMPGSRTPVRRAGVRAVD